MVTLPEIHDVTLQAPWYAPAGRTVAIQRYLDAAGSRRTACRWAKAAS